ncbi:Zinc finger protein [Penaeus vannamei]|uniref:Zinc finger protein n=1 Tax=Penaeus vannamei TaxID=6689 RepID=A0A423THB3_PENVA|nr:Zinc finger protein [Penaeus vannamei]
MASATLNSGLLEALVSRGTTPQAVGEADPQPGSPGSAGGDPTSAHHAYLHAHFQGVANHYEEGSDLHDVSTSGGDATTEDDETSLNDQLSHYYQRGGDDSHLSASAKKRRKQSNPVRLPTPQGDLQEQPPSKPEEAQFDSEMSNPSGDGEEGIACPHCHVEAPSEDSLRRHIIEEHIGRLLTDDEARLRQQREEPEPGENRKSESEPGPLNLSSPRWDGRPPSRHHDEEGRSPPTSIPMPPSFGDGKLGMPGLLPLGPPPFLFPFLQQQAERERMAGLPHSQQALSPSSSSSSMANGQQQQRIFNQQAYCDLCHKEFCNKYFLKTHKANKHGIYSPETSSSPTGIPSSHSTPLGPSVSMASSMTSPLGPSLATGGFAGSPYAGAFITTNMNALPLRPLLPSQLSVNKPSSKDSSTSNKTGGVINLEAYCELCQKEFCNKYFLKRHKAKIHGINIEVVTKPKNAGQMPPRVAPDRPEGWCDACRRDIGSRASLNAHKLQAHGPHIVAPLPSPHTTSPHTVRNPRTPTPKESRRDGPDHREYFSPWESYKDARTPVKVEQSRDLRESPKDIPGRSPWDRPLGSPWDAVRDNPRSDRPLESPKDNRREHMDGMKKEESWNEQRLRNEDQYHQHAERSGYHDRLSESGDFPLDARDMQAMREQQHREWEMQQRDLENHERDQQQREREHLQREREHQMREQERPTNKQRVPRSRKRRTEWLASSR